GGAAAAPSRHTLPAEGAPQPAPATTSVDRPPPPIGSRPPPTTARACPTAAAAPGQRVRQPRPLPLVSRACRATVALSAAADARRGASPRPRSPSATHAFRQDDPAAPEA